jgi:hypothetical protein
VFAASLSCRIHFSVSVGILLNRDVRAEGRAALSEAGYHALKDFSSGICRGPIANISNLLFEVVRSSPFLPMPFHIMLDTG